MPKKTKINPGESVTVTLKKFNMNKIKDNTIIVFIGKRNTGKSVLLLDYLYHHRQFPVGTVISPTDNYNHTYRPHVPSIFIHEEYTPELLEQILKRQKDICKKCKNKPSYAEVDPKTFVILDDCLADGNEWVKDKNIKFLFMNGRHVKATFILTMQYALGIPPSLRGQIDYVFICKETKACNLKRLYEHYASMFPTMDMFKTVLNKCTNDYGCLVIDNTSNSDKIDEQVYWYRTNINKPDWETFKMCYNIFWEGNEKYLAGKDDEKEEKVDFNRLIMKKNQINFDVKQVGGDNT
jgi:hypothetical protein